MSHSWFLQQTQSFIEPAEHEQEEGAQNDEQERLPSAKKADASSVSEIVRQLDTDIALSAHACENATAARTIIQELKKFTQIARDMKDVHDEGMNFSDADREKVLLHCGLLRARLIEFEEQYKCVIL